MTNTIVKFNRDEKCPINGCGAHTEVKARGWGNWTEIRECDKGHEFKVSYDHSNDLGTVTQDV